MIQSRIRKMLLLLLLHTGVHAQDILIERDTIINDVWRLAAGSILHFGSKGHISGSGTIYGGIIDASLHQWIFDTSLTVMPAGTYGQDFSACWFGAGYIKDNSAALQKGINTIIDNPKTLRNFFIPKGEYFFSRPLHVKKIYRNEYVGVTIHIYGESSFWDCCGGTQLKYTGTDRFALGLQVNKGSEINNLEIYGQFTAPKLNDSAFYNLSFDKYKDASGKCGEMYAGIVIDYDGSLNTGGSTGVKIHDVSVGNFSIDYLVSPNGKTFNAEILLFENIRCGDAKVGFATGQAQEKGNVIRGIYSWGSLHTLFSCGRYGKKQAGNYLIDGGNIANRTIRLFDITQSGWYTVTIQNIFAESIGSVGNITSQIPVSVSNSTFHFVFPKKIVKQVLFYGNTDKISFNNCLFRYYGLKGEPMKFSGMASFNNCHFSGPLVKN